MGGKLMTLLTKEAVEAYNQEHTDEDDLIFEEVQQELSNNLDFAVESLLEQLRGVRERWFDRHCEFSEFLDVHTDLVSARSFADEVIGRVEILDGDRF